MQQAKMINGKKQTKKNPLKCSSQIEADVLDGCFASELRYNGQSLGSNHVTLTYVPKVEPLLSGTSGKVQQAQMAVRGRLGNFHKHAQVDFSRR